MPTAIIDSAASPLSNEMEQQQQHLENAKKPAANNNNISDITVYYLRENRDDESLHQYCSPTNARVKELIEKAVRGVFASVSQHEEKPVNVKVIGQSSSFVEGVWEPTKGDFHTAVHDKVHPYARFDALVVVEVLPSQQAVPHHSSNSSSICAIVDGEVMYALHEKRIPVLRIVVQRESTTSSSSHGSASIRKHKMLTTEIISSAVSSNEEKREAATNSGNNTASPSSSSSATNTAATTSRIEAAIKTFFTFPKHQGRVIVLEGGDGAGKQTQVKLLYDRLKREGYTAETLDYPHDAAGYGVLIRELLSGKMGNIREVNPLIFATLYGLNRHSTLPLLKYWLQRGANIVLDRYMTANFGHQASKYEKDEDRINAINTLRTFELKWLNLPDADKVFYLNLPPDFALRAMQSDATRRELDMHELAGIEYKNNVRRSFLWCCKTFSDRWTEVKCVDDQEKERFSREVLHEEIYAHVAPLLVKE